MLSFMSNYRKQLTYMGWCSTDYDQVVGYDIDFAAIIRYEFHERVLGEITTLSFPCLFQIFYDEVSMLEVPSVDARVDTMGVVQTSMIKDPTNPILTQRTRVSLIVIPAQCEGALVPAKPTDRQGGDAGISMDFEIGEYRETHEMRT